MNSVYTEEVEKVFKSIENPDPRFIVDIFENPVTNPGLLFLLVYSKNIEQLDEQTKIACATYLYQVRDTLRQITPCEIQGIEGFPAGKRMVTEGKDRIKRERDGGNNGLRILQ